VGSLLRTEVQVREVGIGHDVLKLKGHWSTVVLRPEGHVTAGGKAIAHSMVLVRLQMTLTDRNPIVEQSFDILPYLVQMAFPRLVDTTTVSYTR
jgi:hypothetical protein